jgi:hypothetical protein
MLACMNTSIVAGLSALCVMLGAVRAHADATGGESQGDARVEALRLEPKHDSGNNWQRVREDEGIATWVRLQSDSARGTSVDEGKDEALPTFRGRMVADANLWELVAVLEDVDRASEWTANCAEMRGVAGSTSDRLLVYARMDAPWPVKDRDVITEVTSATVGTNTLLISIRAVSYSKIPTRPGVVRIPKMIASYRLEQLSENRTRVWYEVELDPGGTLPDWLKTMVARDLAHNTLSRLRDRARWAAQHNLYESRASALKTAARERGFGTKPLASTSKRAALAGQ